MNPICDHLTHTRRLRAPGAALACAVLTTLMLMPGSHGKAAPSDAQATPSAADLRPGFEKLNLPRRSQGSRPTCSVFVVTGALEFALAKAKGTGQRLSVEYLNWAGNQGVDAKQDGGFFSDLWKGFETHGICAEATLPYASAFDPGLVPPAEAKAEGAATKATGLLRLKYHWIKEWDVNTGLTKGHMAGIKQTLASGWPVCAGLRWPKKEAWKDGVLQLCGPEAVRDGHSVLLVGFKEDAEQPGGGVFIFRNSSNAAKDGLMPYAYAEAYMNDASWIEWIPPQENAQ